MSLTRRLRQHLPMRIAGLIIFGFPQLAAFSIGGTALVGTLAIAIGFLTTSWVAVKWVIPFVDDLCVGPWFLCVEGDRQYDMNMNDRHGFKFVLRRKHRSQYDDANRVHLGWIRSSDPDLDEKILDMRLHAQEVLMRLKMATGKM